MHFENNFLFNLTKKKDFSRRSSYDYGEARESEVVVLKERRLVPLKPVREGMHRFSFLLEVCVPGSVPDPQLIAAILDLVSTIFSLYFFLHLKSDCIDILPVGQNIFTSVLNEHTKNFCNNSVIAIRKFELIQTNFLGQLKKSKSASCED